MISGSSAFSKASLNIWKFTVHVLLKPGLENFEHHFFTFTFHFHVTSLVAQMVSVCLQCRRPRFDSLACIGEGNDNPLQCSCLENPRDAGAWWAAIYGVSQSRTQLKQLSSSSSGGDGIPVELFQVLKDDAVKVLHSICQQIWKTQQ